MADKKKTAKDLFDGLDRIQNGLADILSGTKNVEENKAMLTNIDSDVKSIKAELSKAKPPKDGSDESFTSWLDSLFSDDEEDSDE
jgi:hypothetical protein